MQVRPARWVLFCRVIDYLGDAGVAWRLANQLATEHDLRIDLVIDRPELVQQFGGTPANIRIFDWNHVPEPGAVTIACFACHLPQDYRRQLKQALSENTCAPRYWFNLEYLSSESWIEGCHLLDSTKPEDLLVETFYFPGFTERTGGLIREQRRPPVNDRALTRQQFGLSSDALCISLFCYEHAPIDWLLEQLGHAARKVELVATAGVPERIKSKVQEANRTFSSTVKVIQLPFLTHTEFDKLLSVCDLNFVRGEDSLVRAIWARQCFVWQAYPQEEPTRQVKIEALLNELYQGCPASLTSDIKRLHELWNFPASSPAPVEGLKLLEWVEGNHWRTAVEHACDRLSLMPDLASQLVSASRKIRGFANVT